MWSSKARWLRRELEKLERGDLLLKVGGPAWVVVGGRTKLVFGWTTNAEANRGFLVVFGVIACANEGEGGGESSRLMETSPFGRAACSFCLCLAIKEAWLWVNGMIGVLGEGRLRNLGCLKG